MNTIIIVLLLVSIIRKSRLNNMIYIKIFIGFIIPLLFTLLATPLFKKIAFIIGATDVPSARKMHVNTMPRLGGLSIVCGVILGLVIVQPYSAGLIGVYVGGLIIVATGVMDDLFSIRPVVKLIGQILAALSVMTSGLLIDKLTVPIIGTIDLGILSYIVTIFWVVGMANAINLVDGLDGLAAGVSAIALTSIVVTAIMDYRLIVIQLSVVVIGSTLGFLYHNFYPAKIFMGDTGALFLGYTIAVISMLGLFKNVAVFSFLGPIIIVAIPVFDTLFAIIRRALNGQRIGVADKKHIHHRLLEMGYNHKTAVLIIYFFSAFFGLMAIFFTSSSSQTSLLVLIAVVMGIQFIAEITNIITEDQRYITNSVKKILQWLKL